MPADVRTALSVNDPIAIAVVEVIREQGLEAATTDEFVECLAMDRQAFDRRFPSKREVVETVIDAHIDHLRSRVEAAYAGEAHWPDNLRAAVYETARYVLEYPEMTWILVVGIFEASDTIRAHRDQLFAMGAELIDAGRSVAENPADIPSSAPLMVVGGFGEIFRRRQAAGIMPDLATNLPMMMYGAVRPYLGEEAAKRELAIELPPDLLRTNS